MTQAALAKIINEKPAVINQYENGKAIPNGQVRYDIKLTSFLPGVHTQIVQSIPESRTMVHSV